MSSRQVRKPLKYAQFSVEAHIAAAKERAEDLARQEEAEKQKQPEQEAMLQQVKEEWEAEHGIGGLTIEEFEKLNTPEMLELLRKVNKIKRGEAG